MTCLQSLASIQVDKFVWYASELGNSPLEWSSRSNNHDHGQRDIISLWNKQRVSPLESSNGFSVSPKGQATWILTGCREMRLPHMPKPLNLTQPHQCLDQISSLGATTALLQRLIKLDQRRIKLFSGIRSSVCSKIQLFENVSSNVSECCAMRNVVPRLKRNSGILTSSRVSDEGHDSWVLGFLK